MSNNQSLDKNFQVGGNHYKGTAFEHWDWVNNHKLNYLEGCATKYISRWKKKHKYSWIQRKLCALVGIKLAGQFEDLEKAKHYIDKLIEQDEMAALMLYNQTGDNPTWFDNFTRTRCSARETSTTEDFINAQSVPLPLAHAIRLIVHARSTVDLSAAKNFISEVTDGIVDFNAD